MSDDWIEVHATYASFVALADAFPTMSESAEILNEVHPYYIERWIEQNGPLVEPVYYLIHSVAQIGNEDYQLAEAADMLAKNPDGIPFAITISNVPHPRHLVVARVEGLPGTGLTSMQMIGEDDAGAAG